MTSKLTREERVQSLYDLKIGQVLNPSDIENIKMLARMALAAMDSEPVAWTWQHRKQWHVTNCEGHARELAWDGVKVEPLYRHAQPLPVAPDSPVCTCPSGDGSLRWPCPVHPGNSPVVPDGMERIATTLEYIGNFAGAAIIRQLAANQQQNAQQNIPEIIPGWIPVSERMPEAEGHYLVWANASRIDGNCDHLAIATYQGGEWSNEFNWLVTHWMPLPAAPQEVK
ncbi:DUF551 domain-containing protein [Klebsiella pneumoniae]